jgi:hypothetical protein
MAEAATLKADQFQAHAASEWDTVKSQCESASKHRPDRRSYGSPVLTKFGRVKDLVKAGSHGTSEGNYHSGCSTSHDRCKPCSDRRLKEDLVRIGTHASGIGLYLFTFKHEYRDALGHGRRFGVIADEVELVLPDAVSVAANGYNCVDYAMLGIELAGG